MKEKNNLEEILKYNTAISFDTERQTIALTFETRHDYIKLSNYLKELLKFEEEDKY